MTDALSTPNLTLHKRCRCQSINTGQWAGMGEKQGRGGREGFIYYGCIGRENERRCKNVDGWCKEAIRLFYQANKLRPRAVHHSLGLA